VSRHYAYGLGTALSFDFLGAAQHSRHSASLRHRGLLLII
jgi:hypothetical protein